MYSHMCLYLVRMYVDADNFDNGDIESLHPFYNTLIFFLKLRYAIPDLIFPRLNDLFCALPIVDGHLSVSSDQTTIWALTHDQRGDGRHRVLLQAKVHNFVIKDSKLRNVYL